MRSTALSPRHLVALLPFFLLAGSALAQVEPPTTARTPGIYQRFAHPGEPTVPVIVMGLGGGGLYDVGVSVSLDELVVLAGGTSLNPRSQHVLIRVYRDEGVRRDIIYESRMREMLEDKASYPTLRHGDLVYIETWQRRRFDWRDGLRIVSAASTLTYLIFRLIDRF